MIGRVTKWRKVKNILFSIFNVLSATIVVLFVFYLLYTVFQRGALSISWNVFTKLTPAPFQKGGGLLNAIIGSFEMVGMSLLFAIPVGILIATYITEFGNKTRWSSVVRFTNNVLLGNPSILAGLFVYLLFVVNTGHMSAIAGSIALTLLSLPMIVRSSEDVLYLVPKSLKESAVALGVPRYTIIFQIIYRVVFQGLITAVLLALARIMGESAPLLFTSGNNFFLSLNPNAPTSSLPLIIYQYAMSPYENWRVLAWQGVFIITFFIFFVGIVARYIGKK